MLVYVLSCLSKMKSSFEVTPGEEQEKHIDKSEEE